jgi:hypothetical protein
MRIHDLKVEGWPIWENYSVVEIDDVLWLRPDGDPVRTLDLSSERLLPQELARVNRPWGRYEYSALIKSVRKENPKLPVGAKLDELRVKALIAFMKQFGYLGQTILAGKRKKIDGEFFDGDELAWALWHAENVDACLWLLSKLGGRQWNSLRDFFSRRPLEERTIPTVSAPFSATVTVPRLSGDQTKNAVEAATRALISALLNPNLEGVSRVCDGKESRFRFTALIQIVYWRLADFIGSRYLRQCIECKTPFFATDNRQVFCPPPGGVRESRCGKRHQMREFRNQRMGRSRRKDRSK